MLGKTCKDKLFKAVISDVLTHHEVKQLVYHLRLAVQLINFKVLYRLTLIHSVEFVLELIKDPWHRSGMSLNFVDFETLALQNLNLRGVKADFFFDECVVILSVDLQDELVFGRG